VSCARATDWLLRMCLCCASASARGLTPPRVPLADVLCIAAHDVWQRCQEGTMGRIAQLVLAAALSLPLASQALTLHDLNAGASFSSSGGELRFDFAAGSISLGGALPIDLTQYSVLTTATGFIVSGPLAAIGPAAFGTLTLAYRVTASPGLALSSASLQTSGIAFGSGALAIATSGFSNGATLGVLLTSSGGTGATDGAAFGNAGFLDALASVQLFALTPGDVAAFGSVQHGFGWLSVPEAGTSLLLAAGLGGLALLGRPRRRGNGWDLRSLRGAARRFRPAPQPAA
jgi:hypothetical protein